MLIIVQEQQRVLWSLRRNGFVLPSDTHRHMHTQTHTHSNSLKLSWHDDFLKISFFSFLLWNENLYINICSVPESLVSFMFSGFLQLPKASQCLNCFSVWMMVPCNGPRFHSQEKLYTDHHWRWMNEHVIKQYEIFLSGFRKFNLKQINIIRGLFSGWTFQNVLKNFVFKFPICSNSPPIQDSKHILFQNVSIQDISQRRFSRRPLPRRGRQQRTGDPREGCGYQGNEGGGRLSSLVAENVPLLLSPSEQLL